MNMAVRNTMLIAAVLAVCLVVGGRGQGVACVDRLMDDVAQCFNTEGLSLAMSGQQDATKLMRETQAVDPAVQCANLTLYTRAIQCSLNVLRLCLDTVNMGRSIPDSDRFGEGMKVLCAREKEFDTECFRNHYPHILRCGENTVKGVVKERGGSDMTMDDIICLSADVNYDCFSAHLTACGPETRSIYLEQLNNYQVPAACVNRPPGRSGRDSYVGGASGVSLALLAAVASLTLHLLFRLH